MVESVGYFDLNELYLLTTHLVRLKITLRERLHQQAAEHWPRSSSRRKRSDSVLRKVCFLKCIAPRN